MQKFHTDEFLMVSSLDLSSRQCPIKLFREKFPRDGDQSHKKVPISKVEAPPWFCSGKEERKKGLGFGLAQIDCNSDKEKISTTLQTLQEKTDPVHYSKCFRERSLNSWVRDGSRTLCTLCTCSPAQQTQRENFHSFRQPTLEKRQKENKKHKKWKSLFLKRTVLLVS